VTDTLRSQRFHPELHDVSGFSCGVEELDSWLREQAVPAEKRGTARTWVWLGDDSQVVGYYALSAHKVAREEVPSRIGRGGPAEIPAVLLAKLALNRRAQGKGLGPVLVVDALDRIVTVTQIVAARLVVVDALSESVAGFSEELGFRRIPGSLTLVQRVRDIEAALRGPRSSVDNLPRP
jgi:GNAT superfamily N-acetyltransferase